MPQAEFQYPRVRQSSIARAATDGTLSPAVRGLTERHFMYTSHHQTITHLRRRLRYRLTCVGRFLGMILGPTRFPHRAILILPADTERIRLPIFSGSVRDSVDALWSTQCLAESMESTWILGLRMDFCVSIGEGFP
jgi:hypothetical protein